MRHQAAAVEAAAVVRRRSAKAEVDRGLEARIRVPEARRRVRVVPVTTAVQVVQVVPAAPATSAGPVVRVVLVGPATTAAPVDRVVPAVQVTSVVPATTADPAVRAASAAPAGPVTTAAPATSVDPADQATSDSGRLMPSEASAVSRGAMEQRRGAGEHRRAPGGADRSLPRADSGTKGRSTTGATTRTPYGIRGKTVGASTSSESGSRCNERAE
jgi:hypothetical protein